MKIINMARKYGSKVSTGVLAVSVLASSAANAAFTPPAGLAAASTDIQGGVDYMSTLFWPIIISVFVAIKLITLFRRFGNKV
jgi:hypothetical protein